ncbi:MAG: hypothetical protein FWE80_04165, partial [Oscillospiraceae bacterium]|nr:hypothetical protein [Oscillospiraceae bacterium]
SSDSISVISNKYNCVPDSLPYKPVAGTDYHCYKALSETQKIVYKSIVRYVESFAVGGYLDTDCRTEDILIAYQAVFNDYPQFFWMPRSYVFTTSGTPIIYFEYDADGFKAEYAHTPAQSETLAARIKNDIRALFASMPSGLSEFDRELILHDYVCEKTTYSMAAVNNPYSHMYAFSITGVFINNSAVCEGYSRALQLLLYYAGIQNTLVKGHDLYPDGTPDYNGSHMWNIVNIGGVWGHTDCTWNDGEIRIDGLTATAYRWFHIPESELRYDHYIDHSFPLPAADSFAATYFAVNGQLFAGGQPAEEFVAGLIAREAKESRTYVEILCVTPDAIDLQALTTSLNTAEHLAQINAGSGDNPVRLVNIIRRSSRNYWVFWG